MMTAAVCSHHSVIIELPTSFDGAKCILFENPNFSLFLSSISKYTSKLVCLKQSVLIFSVTHYTVTVPNNFFSVLRR